MDSSSQQFKPAPINRRPPATTFQIFILILVIILFSYFLLWPKYQGLLSDQTELLGAQASLQSLHGDQQKLVALEKQLQASPSDTELLDEALPLDSRVSRIYILIDSLVKASGMTVANLTVEQNPDAVAAGNAKASSAPEARKLQTNAINLNITGTIDQYVNFLKQLETSSRLVDLEAMDIGGGDGQTLNFRLKLKTYSYAP